MSGSKESQNWRFGCSSTGTSLGMEDHYVTDFASNRAEIGSSRGSGSPPGLETQNPQNSDEEGTQNILPSRRYARPQSYRRIAPAPHSQVSSASHGIPYSEPFENSSAYPTTSLQSHTAQAQHLFEPPYHPDSYPDPPPPAVPTPPPLDRSSYFPPILGHEASDRNREICSYSYSCNVNSAQRIGTNMNDLLFSTHPRNQTLHLDSNLPRAQNQSQGQHSHTEESAPWSPLDTFSATESRKRQASEDLALGAVKRLEMRHGDREQSGERGTDSNWGKKDKMSTELDCLEIEMRENEKGDKSEGKGVGVKKEEESST